MLTNRWDLAYQYELNKVSDFKEIEVPGSLPWDLNVRPCNHRGVIKVEDIKKDDSLVLHFDDNCLGPSHLTQEDRLKWSEVFRTLANFPFQKIIFVCHGAPPRKDRFNPNSFFQKDLPLDDETLGAIKDIVRDRVVVMPSKSAQKAWGFENSVVIEPAMEEFNFPFNIKKINRGIIIHPAPTADPHGSGYHHSKVVSTELPIDIYGNDSLNEFQSVLPPLLATDNSTAYQRWYDGLDIISESNVCLDLQDGSVSAMSCLTAMYCGVPVVGNGIWNSDLIKHGITGYSSVDLHEIRNYLIFLLKNPDISIRMGKQARKHALQTRPFSQFVKKWRELL
jgi:hypothetical protein